MANPTHRDLYPEQYTHPSVGKFDTVVGPNPTAHGTVVRDQRGRILRVMSSRWGLLVELDGIKTDDGGVVAFHLNHLAIEDGEL